MDVTGAADRVGTVDTDLLTLAYVQVLLSVVRTSVLIPASNLRDTADTAGVADTVTRSARSQQPCVYRAHGFIIIQHCVVLANGGGVKCLTLIGLSTFNDVFY